MYSGRTGERIFKIDGTNVAWSPDMTNDGIGDVMTNAYAYSGKRLRPDFFGPVPGLSGEVNTFTVSDVVAGNSVYLIYGQRDGTAAIPGCPPDAFVDISAPVVFGSSIANPDGVATFRVNVPASANERTVLFQAAVPASCRVTPIVRHTFRDALPTVLLVDDDAGDGGTGWAWASAFQSVRAAVDAAVELGTVTDVWVAEGTYVATVHLANGVAVYGGFRGNEATRDQRRPDRFISTLSGDNRLSPVVRALDVDGTARLDGLSIVDGASGTGAYAAGIDIENASPTIVNCVLSGHGGNRGAVEVTSGNPTFVDCRFTDNMVNFGGGSALTVWAGGPTFERCNFVGNSAQDAGGAAYISGGDTVFNRCVFDRNEIFNGEEGGGALYVFGGRMTLVNSIMTRNDARSWLEVGGGAIYIGRGSGVVEIINSLLAGNTADAWGDAAYNNAILTVSNSIIWSNSIETSRYGSTTVTYSNGDQAFAGVGNISAIPMFVDPFGGDFRLMPGSPCIDAASNSAVPIWVDLDFAGRPRFVDDPDTPDTGEGDPPVVDMGPHEFQP